MNPKGPADEYKFKKGASGNPEGARLHDQEKKIIARLTNDEVKEVGSMLLKGDMEGIKLLAGDDKASVLKKWIATVIVKSMNKGDYKALESILDRLVGKVKQVHAHGQDPDAAPAFLPPQVILTIPDNGRSVQKPEAPKKK